MKTIRILLFVLISYSAHSQLNKGNLFTGGSLSLTTRKDNNSNSATDGFSKYTNINLSPQVGLLLKDKLAGGIALIYTHNTSENLSGFNDSYNSNTTKGSGFSFSPFVRQYFSLGQNIALFINGNAFFGYTENEYRNFSRYPTVSGTFIENENKSTEKYTNWGANISPGIIFFPLKKWSIEFTFASLTYNGTRASGSGSKSNSIGFSYYSSINFGLSYYLRSE